MTNNERRARAMYHNLCNDILDLEEQIRTIKEHRRVVSDYLVTIHGPCQDCQNAHWPHCSETDYES